MKKELAKLNPILPSRPQMKNKSLAHNSEGVTKILETSFFYNFWQIISGTERAKKHIIQEYVKPFENARILDIGCGTGVILEYMKPPIEYVGFDINPGYIQFAKEKYNNRGKFYCISVNDSNVAEKDFDLAISIGILHHLNDEDSEKLIESARKCLKRGGCLIMVEPVFSDQQGKLEKFLMFRDRGKNIRDEKSYLSLLSKHFTKTESYIRKDMFNIPWTLSITKSFKLESQ